MTNENARKTSASTASAQNRFGVNWARLEGVVGLGALLTSFLWFLGMPTGMAFGVGFGIVFLLDVARYAVFVYSKRDQTELQGQEPIHG